MTNAPATTERVLDRIFKVFLAMYITYNTLNVESIILNRIRYTCLGYSLKSVLQFEIYYPCHEAIFEKNWMVKFYCIFVFAFKPVFTTIWNLIFYFLNFILLDFFHWHTLCCLREYAEIGFCVFCNCCCWIVY